MPPRANGPKAGPTLGIKWQKLTIGKPFIYLGTASGCKANSCRASKMYAPMRFRSFKQNGNVYVERIA